MEEFYSKHPSIANKYKILLEYYERNNGKWDEAFILGELYPDICKENTLTIEDAMICIEFVNCEHFLSLVIQSINYINNVERKLYLCVGLHCVIYYSQINKYVLKCANELRNNCKPIDISNELSTIENFKIKYVDYRNIMSIYGKILSASNMFLKCTKKYEKIRSERQKMNILVLQENIKITPTNTNVGRVLECDDLVRFMCEYI
jgi:hypothetical protein